MPQKGSQFLDSNYKDLINELSSKYSFDEQKVQNAIMDAVNSTSTTTSNGRTEQITCEGQCAQGTENRYWAIYNVTHDCDLAMLAALSYETGCLDGCRFGMGGGNP